MSVFLIKFGMVVIEVDAITISDTSKTRSEQKMSSSWKFPYVDRNYFFLTLCNTSIVCFFLLLWENEQSTYTFVCMADGVSERESKKT